MRNKFIVLAAVIISVFVYTKLMAKIGSGSPPPDAPLEQRADLIRVYKAERRMVLLRGDTPISTYRISLGQAADEGPKQREGDEKTPEGRYEIDWRNPKSMAHLSLHISYPGPDDRRNADAGGFPPGGNIMIHGLPNGWGLFGNAHRLWDWTDGCIAVTNAEMRDIWARVPNHTPIEIVP
ncbi:L,D-transpeptidase family protein [Rhizobium laguerreae]|uniref:L,D-transpeptidase family protein n=1 Tax=Rhizobium laguerreae TaxID=1076926 RepID=UPI001C910811|nr:L,D-transpeptidase family protein [Rhizobium laguerreae]MBY3195988.1 L,D-transpeptidase family protein [Rhizobium laguerreae]MBY3206605.1 L,D-transpeptidase family protein [Rhizobium laguerreae]MBY3558700.1 L,D-transpeptidase family protein [Rhizobium laguerreae]